MAAMLAAWVIGDSVRIGTDGKLWLDLTQRLYLSGLAAKLRHTVRQLLSSFADEDALAQSALEAMNKPHPAPLSALLFWDKRSVSRCSYWGRLAEALSSQPATPRVNDQSLDALRLADEKLSSEAVLTASEPKTPNWSRSVAEKLSIRKCLGLRVAVSLLKHGEPDELAGWISLGYLVANMSHPSALSILKPGIGDKLRSEQLAAGWEDTASKRSQDFKKDRWRKLVSGSSVKRPRSTRTSKSVVRSRNAYIAAHLGPGDNDSYSDLEDFIVVKRGKSYYENKT